MSSDGGDPAALKSRRTGADTGRMKMAIEFDEGDATQVANGLVRMLTAALKLGVDVETKDGTYAVTNPGDEECVRRWIGPDGEYRRDVMQRRWVVKESTDPSGRQIPPPPPPPSSSSPPE
jgi:hypothetical protein